MINYRIIARVFSILLIFEGLMMLISALISYLYYETATSAFIYSAFISILAGIGAFVPLREEEKVYGNREGYIIVTGVFLIFSLFGTLPFLFSGSIKSFTDAFFESVSGFTTTGATILTDIDSMPKGILLWRSLTQWIGGMGIIVLSLVILPILGIGGMQLFTAEVPGPTPDKIHPRVKETAKRLWAIYFIFTVAEIILLTAGGMDFFDSVCHSFTTLATGGYSTKNASIGFYSSPFIHYVITLFMIIAGTNFTLSYFAMHLKFRPVFGNEEFRFYISFILVFTFLITVILALTISQPVEKSFRDSLFHVVSIMTTTGYSTTDYLKWIPVGSVILFALMFFGGSAGSTGGSMKIIRIVLMLKNSFLELKRLIQ